MTAQIDHIAGVTFHSRKGGLDNSFRYGIDYVLLDPDHAKGPAFFSLNRANFAAIYDQDHGGPPNMGRGSAWAHDVLAAHNHPAAAQILLLAQPRILGHVFNPVSFWLCYDVEQNLTAVIAEVSNTSGDRHSYLCAKPDAAPISREDVLSAQKTFHVSPFLPVAGGYKFRFDIRSNQIGIWIDYAGPEGGLLATLTGKRRLLTNFSLFCAAMRRPFGSRRVLVLIYWQAMKLLFKGARFRSNPQPPAHDVSK
ncbi:MAG: DUF1365 family protein [Paracoccaceae bacterium]|jgi:DUF1365 family protein